MGFYQSNVVTPHIYEITTTAIEAMDRKVSGYLRRRLGPESHHHFINRTLEQFHTTKLTSILYSGRFKSRQMPLGNYVMGLSRRQNRSGWDPDKVRKWSAKTSLDHAESMLY